jgi:hypothetical protein
MSIFKDPTINAMVDSVDGPQKVHYEGTEGQDRESYTDIQDRESYSGDPTNEERSASAMAALESQEKYHDAWPEGLADSIVDLVSDLLHLARENDIEPDYIIRMAQTHFDAEVEEEAEHGNLD